jgi:uncharacterized protein (DUF58 family)
VEAVSEVTAYRRGPLVLAGGMLARTDPFGLFRAFCRVRGAADGAGVAAAVSAAGAAVAGTDAVSAWGSGDGGGGGESEEVVALREYRRGDSLRRVHWRSSARLGSLIVKEFQDEYFVRHALVLDTFCEAARDALFEEAVAVAASFACTVPDQDSLLDLMFVGPEDGVCDERSRGGTRAADAGGVGGGEAVSGTAFGRARGAGG